MKSRKRAYSIALCCLLAVTVLLPGLVFLFAGATAADDQEESLLGTLSAQFEASSPGMVSSGTGDLGGKSYGAYQFASRYDTPKAFFEWCLQQDDTYYRSVGERLQDAYYSGGAGYGTNFDNTWRALNNEDSAGFLRVQRNYVRLSYYEPIVAKLEANVPGFSADDYSIALRNVLWSRAAQHGTGGAYSVVTRAFAALGGFKNQPEAELIDAIYAESGRLTTDAATTMSGTTAERYGVSGQALAYYTGCSGEVQLGVYLRLRVNEPAKAQAMLRRTYDYRTPLLPTVQGARYDSAALYIEKDGVRVKLTPNEGKLLSCLISKRGKVVSREELMISLWDSDQFVDDNTLSVNMNRLRRKFEEVGVKNCIVTHRARGYALDG